MLHYNLYSGSLEQRIQHQHTGKFCAEPPMEPIAEATLPIPNQSEEAKGEVELSSRKQPTDAEPPVVDKLDIKLSSEGESHRKVADIQPGLTFDKSGMPESSKVSSADFNDK